MDRSYLSDPTVIQASRRLVCIRLATYESSEEARVLKRLFVGRSGELENTTFAILASDGRTQLVRSGRSPDWAFRDAAEMAAFLLRCARAPDPKTARELPVVATVRLALNVAACEGLPLVVVRRKDASLGKRLAPLAWGALAGRFVFAWAKADKELAAIKGEVKPGALLVIQPGPYGQKGTILGRASAAKTSGLLGQLKAAAGRHQAHPKRTIRRHIGTGRRAGVFWETKIPVTDPGPGPRR